MNLKNITRALLITFSLLTLTGCGGKAKKETTEESTAVELTHKADPEVVYIYYFHSKQRCKTCVIVGEIAEKSYQQYKNNPSVEFVQFVVGEEANKEIAEKYNAVWNTLIVAKGDDHIDMTMEAFGSAISSPKKLQARISEEIEKRLK